MSLGFTKQYDTSIYEKDQFIEIWPEISEIGLEIIEGVLEKMDASSILTPGSSSDLLAYIKGCMFMLGFSDVDKGKDLDLYDQHTTTSVVKCRLVMNDMGKNVELIDIIDREFIKGMQWLFNISGDANISKLWSVLRENKAMVQLPSSIKSIPKPVNGTERGVKKAKTDPNAASGISGSSVSSLSGSQIRPGVNFPEDSEMANKSNQYSLSRDGSKRLSQNFKVSDFKCRDGSDVVLINPALIDLLEKIRNHFKKPIKIVSAYRTPKYNRMLRGAAKNSQHMYGNAVDIKIEGVPTKDVYEWIDSWHKGGLGLYPSFTHIDVRDTVGKNIARWGGEKETGMA